MNQVPLLLKIFLVTITLVLISSPPLLWAATVKVTSSPAGAKIVVNELDQGRLTPAVLKNLEEGKKYKIRLLKKGYKEFETSLKVQTGTNQVHGDLEREAKKEETVQAMKKEKVKESKGKVDESDGSKVERAFGYNKMYKEGTYGWLEVSSIPNGAVVYINEERQGGPTPNKYKTPVGTVKVSVVIKGKAVREFSNVKIKPGETTTLEIIDFRDETRRANTKPLLN